MTDTLHTDDVGAAGRPGQPLHRMCVRSSQRQYEMDDGAFDGNEAIENAIASCLRRQPHTLH